MFKTNEYYVSDIIKNIDFILEHMKGLSKDALEEDEVLTDSMVFRLIQMSEAAKNLTEAFKEKYEMIPWGDITALRNRLVHDYGHVDMSVVYNTLTKDVEELKRQLTSIL